MDEIYEYNLKFTNDGRTGHYYVERYNTELDGKINVVYTTKSNTLEVECFNLKVLKIFCREMYEDKSEEILKYDPDLDSNYYKTYFIDRDHFHVHVNTEVLIQKLVFIDTLVPYNVSVNSQEWWLTGINYSYDGRGIVLTKVPNGHSYVDIYFQTNDNSKPVACFTTNKIIASIGDQIVFNGSCSYDPDGSIETFVWDLGDGTYKGDMVAVHSYQKEGNYRVILTVTDDDDLLDRSYEEIIIVERVMAVSMTVDKPVATPGSILTFKIQPEINSTWTFGVKDVEIKTELPVHLTYLDSSPAPIILNNSLSWHFKRAFSKNDLQEIILITKIIKNTENNTIIQNFAELSYHGTMDENFPKEISNIVSTTVNIGNLLAPRIITKVPDVEILEDAPPYNLNLSSYEYDFKDSEQDLKWYITDENLSLYIISGELSDNDIITITPKPNKFGTSLVNLWLEDSDGFTADQALWINITPVDDKPIFSSAPDLIIHYDIPYMFDYEPYVFDIDTNASDLKLSANENISSISNTRSVSLDPGSSTRADKKSDQIVIEEFKITYLFPKTYINRQIFVSLSIFDGTSSDGVIISINVTNDYTPIVKKSLPDVQLYEGEIKRTVFDLDDYFDDPDRDSLFYSFGETYITVTIHDNHTVDISSPTDWHGYDTVTFRARDPMGAIAEDTIIVIVLPINDPPVIEGVPGKFLVHYGYDYSFDLTPYISDKDDPMDHLELVITDTYIRIDPINHFEIIINYPEEFIGKQIPVRLTISDGLDTDYQDVRVKVTENWPPEIIKELPDISFYEDQRITNAFNLNHYFFDKDSKTLFYTYGQKCINITIQPNGIVDLSAKSNWYGVERVTFRATDSTEAFKECLITITVLPVNDAPIIASLPKLDGIVNQLIKIDLTDYISDVDNNITDLIISTISEHLDIVISGREMIIFTNKPVCENITLKVSDGVSVTTTNMNIEIKGEKNRDEKTEISIFFWIILLLIFFIITITGYTSVRRYYGNYSIEEVYWIYNDGSLILYQSKNSESINLGRKQVDKDIFSGMITAIIMATQEAFSDEGDDNVWSIKEIKMDNKNLMVTKGDYTYLILIFKGRSGRKLYSQTTKLSKKR